jgi:hypothetical protein
MAEPKGYTALPVSTARSTIGCGRIVAHPAPRATAELANPGLAPIGG